MEEEGDRADNLLRLSQDLLAIESDDENASQWPSSQNTLAEAAAAINDLTSPSRLPPLTQAGSSSTEERKEEDEVTADTSQTKVAPKGGSFAAIEQSIDHKSQERQNTVQVTLSALHRADEF